MMKRIILSLTIVVILSMTIFVGFASAKVIEDTHGGSNRLRRLINVGKVIDIGENNFTLEKRDLGQYTYFVDEKTKFKMRDVDNPGFSDLSIGDQVVTLGRYFEDRLHARIVILLTDDVNLSRLFRMRLHGEIIELDGDGKSITVFTRAGDEILVLVDEKTRIFGEASAIEEMEIGWKVGFLGRKLEDGTNLAKIIRAGKYPERIRRVGIISEVDDASGNFMIMNSREKKIIFLVDEETTFFSREKQVETLSNVEPGMFVIVAAENVDGGDFLAKRVFLADLDVLLNFGVREAGFVTQVERGSFVIEDRDGITVRFQVDDETRFRSRGEVVDGIEYLDPGMILLVGGSLGEDGENIAKLVVVFQAIRER